MRALILIGMLCLTSVTTDAQTLADEQALPQIDRCTEALSSPSASLFLPHLGVPKLRLEVCTCAVRVRTSYATAIETLMAGLTPSADLASLLACMSKVILDPSTPTLPLGSMPKAITTALPSAESRMNYKPGRLQRRNGCEQPEYPLESRRAEAEGKTRIAILVSNTGDPLDTAIVRSAGPTAAHKLLDYTVAYWLLGCRFDPPLVSDRPSNGWVQVEFQWKLDGDVPSNEP